MSGDVEELPEGWAWAVVSDVTEAVPNIKPEDELEREFAYVDISSIDNQANRLASTKTVFGKDAPSRARRPGRAGTCCSRTSELTCGTWQSSRRTSGRTCARRALQSSGQTRR